MSTASGFAAQSVNTELINGYHSRHNQVVIDREQWIKEAEEAEKADAPLTCGAIVRATIHIGVEEEDRKRSV